MKKSEVDELKKQMAENPQLMEDMSKVLSKHGIKGFAVKRMTIESTDNCEGTCPGGRPKRKRTVQGPNGPIVVCYC